MDFTQFQPCTIIMLKRDVTHRTPTVSGPLIDQIATSIGSEVAAWPEELIAPNSRKQVTRADAEAALTEGHTLTERMVSGESGFAMLDQVSVVMIDGASHPTVYVDFG